LALPTTTEKPTTVIHHLLGLLTSAVFLLNWYGLASQWYLIEKRKKKHLVATQSLSPNQFASSFIAFYSIFIFGMALDEFNHYLVWTRLGALLLLLPILFRIQQEQKTVITQGIFVCAVCLLLCGLMAMNFRPFSTLINIGSDALMVFVTFVLLQGAFHQWRILKRSRSVGALSFSLFRSIIAKDLCTLAFALTIPLSQAWPLVLVSGTSIFARGAVLLEMERLRRQR
jgi:hypothetical protein